MVFSVLTVHPLLFSCACATHYCWPQHTHVLVVDFFSTTLFLSTSPPLLSSSLHLHLSSLPLYISTSPLFLSTSPPLLSSSLHLHLSSLPLYLSTSPLLSSLPHYLSSPPLHLSSPYLFPQVPLQPNSSDCGIFLLHFVQELFEVRPCMRVQTRVCLCVRLCVSPFMCMYSCVEWMAGCWWMCLLRRENLSITPSWLCIILL